MRFKQHIMRYKVGYHNGHLDLQDKFTKLFYKYYLFDIKNEYRRSLIFRTTASKP